MTKKEKLIQRLRSKPNDFTWNELVSLLGHFGFDFVNAGKTSGSRVRFVHQGYPPMILHKPHPTSILKKYQLENIIDFLEQENLL